jgi:hypothetical protein
MRAGRPGLGGGALTSGHAFLASLRRQLRVGAQLEARLLLVL